MATFDLQQIESISLRSGVHGSSSGIMDSFGYVGKKAAVSRHHGGASRGDADMAMIDDTGSARMSWLYRMISNVHMSGDGSYSDYSRSWLARRVDNSDGGASRDRKASEWWEHDPVPIKDQFLQMPANDVCAFVSWTSDCLIDFHGECIS